MGTVEASTTLMAYGVFCLISNILGGWIDARFGMKALLVTFVLQAAALLGLFAVGGTMPLALVFVFSLALLMYLLSVSCITHFMDVARSRHPNRWCSRARWSPWRLTSASRLAPQWAAL